MSHRPWLVAVALLAGASCKGVPTSVLLRVSAGGGLAPPDELRLDLYTEQGREASNVRLPEQGAPELPDEVAIFPDRSSGALRIVVQARLGAEAIGEGWTTVELQAGEQVRAEVVIQPGLLDDADGDGVPDAVDNCRHVKNPDQGPCVPTEAGPPDAGPDRGRSDMVFPDGDPGVVDTSPDVVSDALPPCSCPLGCIKGTSTCRAIVPSGGFKVSSHASIPTLTTDVVVDTTSCKLTVNKKTVTGSLQPTGSGKACVLGLASLKVGKGTTLGASGDHPLVILVSGSVTVEGVIDVGAKGTMPGPGGAAGGVAPTGGPGQAGGGAGGGQVCSCTMGSGDDCGGGGAGFGTTGADGGKEIGSCTNVSGGGKSYGLPGLVPLVGGSGGASGGQQTPQAVAGGGGGGGGALQITAQEQIVINGAVSAGGGGGDPGKINAGPQGTVGGGGGGSGGAVLLEAAAISGSGLVAANGGGGAGAGSIKCLLGQPGEDGAAKLAAAKGGTAGTGCGAGGAGGWGTTKPKAGEDAPLDHGAGGGGGGAAGRIRLNWYQHGGNAPVLVSGVTSLGEVQVK